jgi:hypothetical protein
MELLQLAGVSGDRLEIRSTLDGSAAFLDLEGGQSTAFLDVKDLHAVGFRIAFGQGSIDSGNTDGWVIASVPVLPLASLGALLGIGARRLGSGQDPSGTSTGGESSRRSRRPAS